MDPVQCPGCSETVTPHKLNLAQSKPGKNGEPGGGYFMAASCPNCSVALGRPEPTPIPPAQEPPTAPDLAGVIGLGGLIGHDRATRVMAQDPPAPAAPPALAAPAPCMPPSTDSIISMATARLEFVEVEIAKLRGFEDERDQLGRMISAAAPQSAERKVS